MSQTVDILVKFSAGTHTTSTLHRQRSSSTMSSQAAAESLGRKVYGEGFYAAQLVTRPTAGFPEQWRVYFKKGTVPA